MFCLLTDEEKIILGDEQMPYHLCFHQWGGKPFPLEHLDHALPGLSNADPLN